jgi:GNAT superfamily N-acetyltransferase
LGSSLMTLPKVVERVTELPADLGSLLISARAEAFHALDRLLADWDSGANRFAAPGELFLTARINGTLAGICGLNVDPYTRRSRTGRLRHLYVAPWARRSGVGRELVETVVDAAPQSFNVLELRTDRSEARAFYAVLGFEVVSGSEFVTHRRNLV